jgi:hypothetical protein
MCNLKNEYHFLANADLKNKCTIAPKQCMNLQNRLIAVQLGRVIVVYLLLAVALIMA